MLTKFFSRIIQLKSNWSPKTPNKKVALTQTVLVTMCLNVSTWLFPIGPRCAGSFYLVTLHGDSTSSRKVRECKLPVHRWIKAAPPGITFTMQWWQIMILHVFTDHIHMDWIGRIVDTCKNFTRIDALICCILHSVRTISTRVIGTEAVWDEYVLVLYYDYFYRSHFKRTIKFSELTLIQ